MEVNVAFGVWAAERESDIPLMGTESVQLPLAHAWRCCPQILMTLEPSTLKPTPKTSKSPVPSNGSSWDILMNDAGCLPHIDILLGASRVVFKWGSFSRIARGITQCGELISPVITAHEPQSRNRHPRIG